MTNPTFKLDKYAIEDLRHNINNPLTVIMLLVDQNCDETISRQVSRQVDRITKYLKSFKEGEERESAFKDFSRN